MHTAFYTKGITDTGLSVASGDINGDKISDIIFGSSKASAGWGPDNKGQTYIVFGHSSPFSASFNVSNLDGTNGFTIDGLASFDRLGSAVGGTDITGDSCDDIVTTSSSTISRLNYVYTVFGHKAPFQPLFDLNSLDGANGFSINGTNYGTGFGLVLSGIQDINGDGIGDVAIGSYSPQVYIIFGEYQ